MFIFLMDFRRQKQFSIITINSATIDLSLINIFDLDRVKSFDAEIGLFSEQDVKTTINKGIVLYLSNIMFNRLYYIDSMLSLHLLVVKIVEFFGHESIIISVNDNKYRVTFKSKEFVKRYASNIDYKISVKYEYDRLSSEVKMLLPISTKAKSLLNDTPIVGVYYCNSEHKKALNSILPEHKVELLDYPMRIRLILIMHCLSVGEWCVYNFDGCYYTTNNDFSNLETFDTSMFDNLRRVLCHP